jgi:tetratricopeptide (TPR) repeat protein
MAKTAGSKSILLILCLSVSGPVFGQRAFVRGEELFMQNKPGEALPYLETAAAEEPGNIPAFLYLGMACLQLNRVDEAIAVYLRVLPKGGDEQARIAYNLGNAYYTKEQYPQADSYYTQAIETDPSLAPAYLNRANTKIRQGALKEAIGDYEQYLSLEPRSSKRQKVEALIAYISGEFIAAEQRRYQAEMAAAAEAERRRLLMEELAASLHAAAEDGKGLSAGTEEVQSYEGEFELE